MSTARDALSARATPFMKLSDVVSSELSGNPATPKRVENRFGITRNAIVTGGLGTLGLAAARALLEHGLSGIALCDFNASALEVTMKSSQNDFPTATIIGRTVNVTDEDAVNTAVIEASHVLGSINLLLCFAGVVGCTYAIEMNAAEWRRTLDINTTGSFLCAQAVAKQMISAGIGGSIVLIASISAHRVNFPQPEIAYNVGKAGVLAMKNSLAAEWVRFGIRVNSISLGYMKTTRGIEQQIMMQSAWRQTDEERKCVQLFRQSNPYENQKNRTPRRGLETGKWFLENDKFLNWRENEGPDLLWLSAKPGSGKSVLAKTIIDEGLVTLSHRKGRNSMASRCVASGNEKYGTLSVLRKTIWDWKGHMKERGRKAGRGS